MATFLYIFLGGGAGSLCRYLVSTYSGKIFNTMYPAGTFIVNLAGSFFIGILFELFERQTISTETRAFLLVGFLGGFTTFSSFALENTNLLRSGEYRYFWTNILSQNILSLAFVLMGVFLVRYTLKALR